MSAKTSMVQKPLSTGWNLEITASLLPMSEHMYEAAGSGLTRQGS